MKKAAAHLRINYYALAEWRKAICQNAKEARIASEQNAVERAGTCHAARNTEAEKSKVQLRQPNIVAVFKCHVSSSETRVLTYALISAQIAPFQSSHFVQMFNFKERNTQGCSQFFCRRPEEVSTQGVFSYTLENAQERVRPVVSMCKTLKGDGKQFFTSGSGTDKDETLATSSGRNT